MKKNIYISLLASALVLASCDKFLEEDPRNLIVPDNFYSTPSDAVTAVNAVYQAVLRNEVVTLQHFWLNEMTADDARRGGTFVVEREAMDVLTYDTRNSNFSAVWGNRYKAINRANEVLIYVNPANAKDLCNRVWAEARFLRAFCYFDLVRWFGDVPLLTGLASDDLYPSRVPKEQVYELIIEDLEFAEQHLDDKYSYMDMNGGRATKGAAKSLLGKVYLTMAGAPLKQTAMYAEAENKFLEVITNKDVFGYEFMANYEEIFPKNPTDAKKAANSEAIFYTRATAGLPSIGGSWAFTRFYTWIINYNSINASLDVITPKDTVETGLYTYNDARRHSNLAKIKSGGQELVGVDDPTQNSQVHVVKYFDPANGNNAANDFIWLRYTDVLLMYAETLIEQNKELSKAKDIINQTRTRAGIGNTAAAENQLELREELRAERRREFLFEGLRRNDLIRWEIFVPTVKDGLTRDKNLPIESFSYITKDVHGIFPIPENETVTNPNITQNPGY